LRDIKARRTNFSPVSPDDLGTLIEMGLIEMQSEFPSLPTRVITRSAGTEGEEEK